MCRKARVPIIMLNCSFLCHRIVSRRILPRLWMMIWWDCVHKWKAMMEMRWHTFLWCIYKLLWESYGHWGLHLRSSRNLVQSCSLGISMDELVARRGRSTRDLRSLDEGTRLLSVNGWWSCSLGTSMDELVARRGRSTRDLRSLDEGTRLLSVNGW
jgi:hypothetical protein